MKSVPSAPAASNGNGTERAAQAIVELINSRPRSPRPEEIVAILDTLVRSPAATASCRHCAALDREYGPIVHSP